jgi:transcriptional regulator with XRE-family HTH domain
VSGVELKEARRVAGWTQAALAGRLQVTQAYVSFLERGKRPVPMALARRLARLLRLSPTSLPLPDRGEFSKPTTNTWVEASLARLGYPGYAHRRRPGGVRNPSEVLLRALNIDDLDPRLLEALPWLLLRFGAGDYKHLVERARFLNLQNRLGFTAALAEQLAKRQEAHNNRAGELRVLLASLEPFRLAREDTLGPPPRTQRMRKWLRAHRSATSAHWNILSDLVPEHLSYGP